MYTYAKEEDSNVKRNDNHVTQSLGKQEALRPGALKKKLALDRKENNKSMF